MFFAAAINGDEPVGSPAKSTSSGDGTHDDVSHSRIVHAERKSAKTVTPEPMIFFLNCETTIMP